MLSAPPQSGNYRLIYADPPWTFATYSRKGKGRSAEAHYDCMSLEEIKILPVAEWAAADCVLLMWVTDPMLPKAIEVMGTWGFTYKTVGFYWAKTAYHGTASPIYDPRNWPIGTGYWTRANPEQCLLATRGYPKRLSADVRKLIVSSRRQHSRKPDEAYSRIEALCAGPYLEMFARNAWPKWDHWPDDVTGIEPRRWRSDSYPSDDEC